MTGGGGKASVSNRKRRAVGGRDRKRGGPLGEGPARGRVLRGRDRKRQAGPGGGSGRGGEGGGSDREVLVGGEGREGGVVLEFANSCCSICQLDSQLFVSLSQCDFGATRGRFVAVVCHLRLYNLVVSGKSPCPWGLLFPNT